MTKTMSNNCYILYVFGLSGTVPTYGTAYVPARARATRRPGLQGPPLPPLRLGPPAEGPVGSGDGRAGEGYKWKWGYIQGGDTSKGQTQFQDTRQSPD